MKFVGPYTWLILAGAALSFLYWRRHARHVTDCVKTIRRWQETLGPGHRREHDRRRPGETPSFGNGISRGFSFTTDSADDTRATRR